MLSPRTTMRVATVVKVARQRLVPPEEERTAVDRCAGSAEVAGVSNMRYRTFTIGAGSSRFEMIDVVIGTDENLAARE